MQQERDKNSLHWRLNVIKLLTLQESSQSFSCIDLTRRIDEPLEKLPPHLNILIELVNRLAPCMSRYRDHTRLRVVRDPVELVRVDGPDEPVRAWPLVNLGAFEEDDVVYGGCGEVSSETGSGAETGHAEAETC